MSKSMAIDGVMKIFLMVAVIIVGMSFLMKAFGIDFFGWIEDLFGGLGLTEGRFLYVKLDTNPRWLFDFRVVGEGPLPVDDEASELNYNTYFIIPKLSSSNPSNGKCTILTAENNGRSSLSSKIGTITGTEEKRDRGGVYQVVQGTTLDSRCTSIVDCIQASANPKYNLCEFREAIDSAPSGSTCNSRCMAIDSTNFDKSFSTQCEGPFSYVDCDATGGHIYSYQRYLVGTAIKGVNYCDFDKIRKKDGNMNNDGLVINQNFNEVFAWGCGSNCNLLDKSDLIDGSVPQIKIKYGVICDPDGNWQICKKAGDMITAKDPTTGISKSYRCNSEGGDFLWQ